LSDRLAGRGDAGQRLGAAADANDQPSCVADHPAWQSQQMKAQRRRPLVSRSLPDTRCFFTAFRLCAITASAHARGIAAEEAGSRDDTITTIAGFATRPLIQLSFLNPVPTAEGS